GSKVRQQVVVATGPAVFDHDAAALDEALLPKRPKERRQATSKGFRRSVGNDANHRHRRLLCACRERPRRRTAEHRDELTPPHVLLSIRGLPPYHAVVGNTALCITARLGRPCRSWLIWRPFGLGGDVFDGGRQSKPKVSGRGTSTVDKRAAGKKAIEICWLKE